MTDSTNFSPNFEGATYYLYQLSVLLVAVFQKFITNWWCRSVDPTSIQIYGQCPIEARNFYLENLETALGLDLDYIYPWLQISPVKTLLASHLQLLSLSWTINQLDATLFLHITGFLIISFSLKKHMVFPESNL